MKYSINKYIKINTPVRNSY